MSGRSDLEYAAELLGRLTPQATAAPWRDSTVDGNRYAALVSDTCVHRPRPRPWGCTPGDHEGYGGCLVAESLISEDRRLMAVLRNVAEHLPDLLRAVAHEDPNAAGIAARAIAHEITDTHTPRGAR